MTENSNDYTGYDEVIYRNDFMKTMGRDPYYTAEEVKYVKDNNINYNLYDIIWQDPSQQQHSFSASGGSKRTSYYFMGGYHKSLGSIKNTKYQKYNFRSNVTSQLTDELKLNVNVSGNQRETDRFFWPYDWDNGEGFTLQDFYRASFNMSRLYPWYVDKDGNPLTSRTADAIPVSQEGFHPGEIAFGDGNRKNRYRTSNIKARLDWNMEKLVKGLSTSVMANLTAHDSFQKDLRLHQTFYTPTVDPNNRMIFDKTVPVSDWSKRGHGLSQPYENIYQRSSFSREYQLNWFLNYKRSFGKHHIDALSVVEVRRYDGNWMNGTAYKLMTQDVPQIFATSSDSKDRSFSGGEGESAYSSAIGRLNYNYAEKYIVEASFRYDGNYRFSKDERWGFFPSVSAGWRLSEESFLQPVEWLSNLKLRGSFGMSGNDGGIAAFQYQDNYKGGSSYVFGSSLTNGIKPGTVPNPNITWAKTEMWNIGADYEVLGGKISGEIDYFNRRDTDILGSRKRTIPTTWGGSAPKENYRENKSYGVEFSIKYSDNIGDVKFDVGFNMGYAKDEVVKVDETEGLEDWRSAIGKPAHRLGGYKSKGIIRDQATLDALPEGFTQFGRKPMLGVLLFEDIRGANYSEGPDGKIDGNDWTYLSDNGKPRINYGFFVNATWKGLSVNALFQGVGAYDKMVSTMNTGNGGVFQVGSRPYFGIWADHWSEENPDAEYPRAGPWGWGEVGYAPSSFWMKNGAYLRLRNLNITYDLPKKLMKYANIEKFQIFFNGSNLFTISDFDGIMDPEQKALDSYPLMKTYSLGINLTF